MSVIINIIRANAYDSETIVSFYDVSVDFGEGMSIRFNGLKLIKAKKDGELFLGLPQREHEGKWYDYYSPSDTLRTQLLATLKARYEQDHK